MSIDHWRCNKKVEQIMIFETPYNFLKIFFKPSITSDGQTGIYTIVGYSVAAILSRIFVYKNILIYVDNLRNIYYLSLI